MDLVVLRLNDTNVVDIVANRPVRLSRIRTTRLDALLGIKVDANPNFAKIKRTPVKVRLW